MHRGRDGQERLGRGVETVTVGNISGENLAILADAVTKYPRYANLQELLDAHSDDPGDCRCENCKYWSDNNDNAGERIPEGWRICNQSVFPGEGVTALVSGRTFSESGFLFTAPDHCCSMWR